jgi:hypothetical protein
MTGKFCIATGGIQTAKMEIDLKKVSRNEPNLGGKRRSKMSIVGQANQNLRPQSLGKFSSAESICFLSLEGRGREKLIDSHHERQTKRRNAKSAKNERRSSVLKSLAVLDIEDDDADYRAPHNSRLTQQSFDNDNANDDFSSNSQRNTGRYLRRGSVTRHKIQADLIGMQPSEKACGGGDESDYGSNHDSDYERQKERKMYLRRGSVTKYSLDYISVGAGRQPENVASSNKKMFKEEGVIVDDERLPSPPTNDSLRRNGHDGLPSLCGKARSCHLGSHHHKCFTKRRSKGGRVSRRGSMKMPSNYNPRPGDEYWSGNINDSGHQRRDMFFDSPEEILPPKSLPTECLQPKSASIASSVHSVGSAAATSTEFHPITPHKPRSGRRICVDEADLFTAEETSSRQDHSESILPSTVKTSSVENALLDRKNSGSSFDSDESSVESFGTDSIEDLSTKSPDAPTPRIPCPPHAYSFISKPISSLDNVTKKLSTPGDRERNLFTKMLSGSTVSSSEGSTGSCNSIEDAMALRSGKAIGRVPRQVCRPLYDQVGFDREKNSVSKWGSAAAVALVDRPESCTEIDWKPSVICGRKKVQFGRIVITEFPIILGDNPAVTSGAPITIDWLPQGERVFSVESYEQCKPARRRRRRLLISVSHRAILLLAAGYSIDDIADASINAQQIKFSRQETMQASLYRERVSLLMENTNDAFSGMVQNTGKKLRALITKPVQHSETARTA